MDADEQDILNYLIAFPRQFVSGREICRRAGGKKRFNDEPYWANQVLLRMVEKGLLEMDSSGHYRLKPDDKREDRKKRWISPQIQELLKESGKEFDGIIETGENTGTDDKAL